MKRPLFNGVVMFALGEVICIMSGKAVYIGTLFCVLIFVGIFYCIIRKYFGISIVLAMGIAGFVVMYLCMNSPIRNTLLINENSATYSSAKAVWANVNVSGKVKDIEESIYGYNIVIEIKITRINNSYCGFSGVVKDRYNVILFGYKHEIRIGTKIQAEGTLRLPEKSSNPGGFDSLSYYESNDIFFILDTDSIIISDRSYSYFSEALRNAGKWGTERLKNICAPETASIYEGILFGNRKSVNEYIKDLYQMSGIAHILAISGLHISIVSGFLYRLLRKINVSVWTASALSIFAAIMYGAMSGFGISTVRALIMLTIAILGNRLGKSYDMLTGLAIAVFLILINNPMSIKNQSLILSVCAIFGVCLGIRTIKIIMKGRAKRYFKRHRLMKKIAEGFIMSVCINAVTFPVIAYMYFEIPVYSFILNIVVVALMTVVVYSGFMGILMSVFSLQIGRAVISIGAMTLDFFRHAAEICLKLPFSVINTGRPFVWCIVGYYMLLIFILSVTDKKTGEYIFSHIRLGIDRRKWRKLRYMCAASACTLFIIIMVCIQIFKNKEMLVFLNVGQGDGIIVSTHGGTIVVIDGGSSSEKAEKLAEYTLKPALKSLKMADVDFWVVTHGDSDHVNGLIYILENYEMSNINIKCILLSKYAKRTEQLDKIETLAKRNDISITYLDAGDRIKENDAEIVCCHPDKNFICDNTNDSSLALSYSSPTMSCIFTGDMGEAATHYMFSHNSELLESSYMFLKVPHHGSSGSLYEPLYKLCSGQNAIISCGENNVYGHPHSEVTDCLKQYGIRYYRTDENGAVIVR